MHTFESDFFANKIYDYGYNFYNGIVDILVKLDYSKHIGLRYFGMALKLEKILGRKVDLVEDNQLMSFAKPSADRDKILIYERGS